MPLRPPPLNDADAVRLAECAFDAIRQRYPHKLDHLILHERDQPLPHEIHPVFDGCYDWHSSVHMHWSLLRLIRLSPTLPLRTAILQHFDEHFTADKVALERRYAAQPGRGGFERPYGWAWLLKLQSELDATADGATWAGLLRPFAADITQRLAGFLGASHYPVRAGTHANSAFSMLLAWEFAGHADDTPLHEAIAAAARRWFSADRNYPADYEPGGTDFLSPGLCEALLMQRVLGSDFAAWWQAFMPSAASLRHWLEPAVVSDRVDAQLVHLDGLNLSRAWCLAGLADALPPLQALAFQEAALRHRDAAWPHVTGGNFAATHWLVSFALLSVDTR